jgi:hypothetical protein
MINYALFRSNGRHLFAHTNPEVDCAAQLQLERARLAISFRPLSASAGILFPGTRISPEYPAL